MKDIKNKVNIKIVYIAEAHAEDEWPIKSCRLNPTGKPVLINQHQTIEQRIEAAKEFQKVFHLEIPMLVDTIDNSFDQIYSSWPIRFYVIQKEKLIYVPEPKNGSYSMEELEKILKSTLNE